MESIVHECKNNYNITAASGGPWCLRSEREHLARPLRREADLTLGTRAVDGARLLEGAERWAATFRATGLQPGDRLVTALPTGSGLAQVLLAGLWEGLTLVPLPPSTDAVVAAAEADPVAAVASPGAFAGREVAWAWRLGADDAPAAPLRELRAAGPRTPLARLLCEPSNKVPWAALLDDNIEHAVDAVLGALQPERARWLSVLPWHTPAGLLLDLLPALLRAHEVIRPAEGDEAAVADVANIVERRQPSHAVLPLSLVRQLRLAWGGLGPLEGLLGGLASGPGIDPGLAADLARTRLRTHRGAPELSCMVTLGEPGIWRVGALGRPVGCTISDGPGGGLLISGRPLAGGRWVDGGLELVDRRLAVAVVLG
jgi:hypothetical protein